MAIVDLVMPNLGESIMEATVLKWLKQPGDTVQQDETVLEIATDKVDSEVPSTAEGTIEDILFQVNDVVPIGAVIATIRTGEQQKDESDKHVVPIAENDQPLHVAERTEIQPNSIPDFASRSADNTSMSKFYSPLVMNIASSEGISMTELEKIAGTGNEGRVTKRDILQFVEEKKKEQSQVPRQLHNTVNHDSKPQVIQAEEIQQVADNQNNQLPSVYGGNVEIIEMDRMRKLIAEHMVRSKHTSPHVTSFSEADVTNLVLWRERVKKILKKEKEPVLLSCHCL